MSNLTNVEEKLAVASAELQKLADKAAAWVAASEKIKQDFDAKQRDYNQLRLLNDIREGKVICLRADNREPINVTFD